MKKKTIRLTESELKKIITESVKRILKENFPFNAGGYYEIELEPMGWPDIFFEIIPVDDDIWDTLFNKLPSIWVGVEADDDMCIDSVKIINKDEFEEVLQSYCSPQDIQKFLNYVEDWLETNDGFDLIYVELEKQVSDKYERTEADYYDYIGNYGRE
jgi:hypothetical protein